MKFIFLFALILPFVEFGESEYTVDNYYKIMAVLNVYHREFAKHITNEYLQKSVGPRSADFSEVTLSFKQEHEINDLVMRKADLRLNYLFLAATPLLPPTVEQTFSNGAVLFLTFESVLSFRVCALYYRNVPEEMNLSLSNNCAQMAAYFSIFGSILLQERVYEFGKLVEQLNKSFLSKWFSKYFDHPANSGTGKDTFTAAKEIERMSKITRLLNDVIERKSFKEQYPLPPLGPSVFDGEGPLDGEIVQEIRLTLARDFYFEEFEKDSEVETMTGDKPIGELEIRSMYERQRIAEESRGEIQQEIELADQPYLSKSMERKMERGESSNEPTSEEKEKQKIEFLRNLEPIFEKYNYLFTGDNNSYGEIYFKQVWKQLLTIYDKSYVTVKKYFNYSVYGINPSEYEQRYINDFIPNFGESKDVWAKVADFLNIAKQDYSTAGSQKNLKDLESNPVRILQEIINIQYSSAGVLPEDSDDATFRHKKFKFTYINPKKNSVQGDLQLSLTGD